MPKYADSCGKLRQRGVMWNYAEECGPLTFPEPRKVCILLVPPSCPSVGEVGEGDTLGDLEEKLAPQRGGGAGGVGGGAKLVK